MEDISKAFSEVYDIINHLEEKLYNRIPIKFIEKIRDNKSNTYKPQIDYSININEQKLLKDTRIILSLIYRDYICSDEKEQELNNNDIKELKKSENEKLKQYRVDNLFKKKNKNIVVEEKKELELVEYKENILLKIIKKIKNILKFIT